MSSENFLVKLIGYPATLLHGDSSVIDRWVFLRRHLAPGSLRTLDAGSGSGAMTMHAARQGNEVLGVSLSDRDNRIAGERAGMLGLHGVRFMTGDLRRLDELSASWDKFDQVICFETIEHISDDRKLLRDLSAVMKSGGRLILTTPYKYYNPLPGDRLSEVEDGGHVRWGYTHEEMRDMLAEVGLDTRAEEYMSGYFSQLLMRFQRSLVGWGVPGKAAWLIAFPFRILQIFDPLAMKMGNYPALSIGVVAVKR